jgi:hypothetical protein
MERSIFTPEIDDWQRRKKVDRRLLIKLVGLPLISFVVPLTWPKRLHADALFETMFGDASVAARVGSAHKKQDAMAVERGRALLADLASIPGDERAQYLRERATEDFAELDVVVADGWVMGRTEADLCAAVFEDRGAA